MQATQVLGAFLLKDPKHEFVNWMRIVGDVTPNRAKQCAGALREWCQACPQLTRVDGDDEDEDGDAAAGSEGGSGSGAGPSGAVAPSSPPLPGPSSVCLAPSGNGAGPSGVGTGSSGVGAGPSVATISSTPASVVADSGIGVGSVPRTGKQRAPAAASVPTLFDFLTPANTP